MIPGTLFALILDDTGDDINPITFGIKVFSAKFCQNEKNEYVAIFFFFFGKIAKIWENCEFLFWPHLDSEFNLEAFL